MSYQVITTPQFYFQVFYRNLKFQECQVSCDTFEEIYEEMERLNFPKFARVEYHNCQGLVGTAYKMRSFARGVYETYKKIKS